MAAGCQATLESAEGLRVPSLQEVCVESLVAAARQMQRTTAMLERENGDLLERKLRLQLELAEVSAALESFHVARRQIVEATRAFVEDVRCALDEPLSSAVLRRLAEVHPTAEECRRAIIDGERGSGLPGPPRAPCDQT